MHSPARTSEAGMELESGARRSRGSYSWAAWGIICALSAGACAPGIDAARQTVANAAAVQSQGFKILEEFDKQHQSAIVDESLSSGDLEGGKKKLAEYRAKRKIAVDALQYAAHATMMANAIIPLVEKGMKPKSELNSWVQEVIIAGIKIYSAFEAIGLKRLGVK